MKNKIIVKTDGSWTWGHNSESVKLWELYPCEDLSKYSKEMIEMMLRAMYRY